MCKYILSVKYKKIEMFRKIRITFVCAKFDTFIACQIHPPKCTIIQYTTWMLNWN